MRLADEGIRAAFDASSYKVEVYREYMDTTLFPDPADQQRFRDFYLLKYRNRTPDVIITVGPSPLKFMQETHRTAFPGVPIVFLNWAPISSSLDSDFTGIYNSIDPFETIAAARRLQPATRHIVVVGGVALVDKLFEEEVKSQLRPYEKTFDISYVTSLTMPDLVERLQHLPNDTIVLFTTFSQDAAGTKFVSGGEASSIVAAAANAPVFSIADSALNHGEVGGKVSSLREEGRIAGSMALRMLNGEKPQGIPRVRNVGIYMFDWRALRRWGLKEGNLPPGSIVLNRQPSFWELYGRFAVAGILIVAIQALIIAALLWQRTGRLRTQKKLVLSTNNFREAQRVAQLGSWHWDPQIDSVTWSEELYRIAGRNPNSPAPTYKEHVELYTPKSWDRLRHAVENALNMGEAYELDLEMILPDGTTKWVFARGEAERDATGGILCLRGTVQDITERKKAESALRESEARFRLVADNAPVEIWMSAVDGQCTYFNERWLRFTGRSLESQLGNGWQEAVHPEDFGRCLDTYSKALHRRDSYQMEYRIKRHDGEYRWILSTGVPRFDAHGSLAGYIGSAIDVTELKLAEEALSTVSQKLIEAHEEERTRIARELHDDVNQRLALLSINLDCLKADLPSSRVDLSQALDEANKQVNELASDVQALSHRLHSSKLEHLGLQRAAESFCRELADRQKVGIDFYSENVPKELSADIALCLFRVLQEALQNAIKHSGSKHFQAALRGGPTELELTVRDDGKGFDLEEAFKGRGIGLTSMRERLKLVNGQVLIDSQPQSGTRIQARVPLNSEMKTMINT